MHISCPSGIYFTSAMMVLDIQPDDEIITTHFYLLQIAETIAFLKAKSVSLILMKKLILTK